MIEQLKTTDVSFFNDIWSYIVVTQQDSLLDPIIQYF